MAGKGPLFCVVLLYGDKAAGRCALVDVADYERINQYRWWVWEVPARNWGPYPITHTARGRGAPTVLMHQFLTDYQRTDHINHDGLDDRRRNLREVTRRQNLHNQRPGRGTASQYKGVSRKRSAWRARIKVEGTELHLGQFANEIEAALAYDAAAQVHFGEYACLNFPDEQIDGADHGR